MPFSIGRSLSLRHLRIVVVLGQELNISRSAGLLFTTQSALSRSLAELEALVGTRLFDRTTKRIRPTASGLLLIQHAKRVLADIDLIERDLAGIKQGVAGALRVGIVPAIASDLLAAALAMVHDVLPEVASSVLTFGLPSLYEALHAGDIDVMLAPAEVNVGLLMLAPTDASVDLQRLRVEEVYHESARVLVASDHPLVASADITMEQLASYPWVLHPKDQAMRSRIDRMLAVHRTDASLDASDVETDSLLLTIELVKRRPMVCLVSAGASRQLSRLGGVVELAGSPVRLSGPMCAVRLKDAPDNIAADTLVRYLRQVAAAPESPVLAA